MKNIAIVLGFAPWIVFAVIAGPSTWAWAALAAFVCSLVTAVPPWVRTRRTNVLDVTGLVFFALLAVAPLLLAPASLQYLEDRAQLLSSVVLVVVVFGGLLAGRPFTEYYARQSTPREYWHSPTFRRINRVLTLVWGLVFVVGAVSNALVLTGASSDVFTWVVPALAIVVGVKITAWYPDHASRETATPAPVPQP